MAFLSFLGTALHGDKKAGGGVLGFLDDTASLPFRGTKVVAGKVTNNKRATDNAEEDIKQTARTYVNAQKVGFDATKDIAQGFARTPEKLVRSGAELFSRAGGDQVDQSAGVPTDPVRKFLYGSHPVETYQKAAEGNKKILEGSRFRGQAGPLAGLAAALTVAGDVTVGGLGKKGGAKIIEDLAKTSDAATVEKTLLKHGVDAKTAKDVSGGIAATKDPHTITSILEGQSKIPNEPQVVVPPPETLPKPAAPAKPEPDPRIESLDTQIKANEQLIKHAPTDQAAAKLHSETADLIKQKAVIEDPLQASPSLPPALPRKSPEKNLTPVKGEAIVGEGRGTTPSTKSALNANNPLLIDPKELNTAQIDALNSTLRASGKSEIGIDRTPISVNTDELKTAAIDSPHILQNSEIQRALSVAQQKTSSLPTSSPSGLAADTGGQLPSAEKTTMPSTKPSESSGKPPSQPKTLVDSVLPGRTRQRSFIKTLQKEGSSSTDQGKKIASEQEQFYVQKPNASLLAKVAPQVKANPELELSKFLSSTEFNDETITRGQLLLLRAQKAKNGPLIKEIQNALSDKLLESGRGSQAAAMWTRLTPQGVLRTANRALEKARKAAPNADQEKPVAGKIKQEVEGTIPVNKSTVHNTVADIANDVEDTTSTGERVAKRVANVVSPKKRKQADMLVDELTKKIKQESLDIQKKPPRPAITVLREVFGRHPEAREAYPEAQALLREKFANNPRALQMLDKFFSSELKLPAADSTINSAIRAELEKQGTKISKVIYDSWANQKQSAEDIAKALTKEGFDEPSAKALAEEVTSRLNNRVAESKLKVLERMSREAPPKAVPAFAEKIQKLSNLGALNNADYLELARARLKLPHLTSDAAKEISSLAQEMQKYDINDPQRYRLVQDIGERIAQDVPVSKAGWLRQILGAPRSLLASFDISGMGRQGFGLGARFPKQFKDSFGTQVKTFASTEKYKQRGAEIAADPDYELMNKGGLALTGVTKKPEEVFESTLLEHGFFKRLGIGKASLGSGIEASNRGYTMGLTDFRFGTAKKIFKDLRDAGIEPADMPKKHLDDLMHYINVFSGRGGKPGGWLERNSEVLSQGLFSPRLWASRLQMLNPAFYVGPWSLKGPAKKLALQNAGSLAAVTGTILGLAVLAGAKVETDARSSDFLKIKVGDTRYDILGGLQQNLVFAHRELSGEKKSSTNGSVEKLGSRFGGADRLSVIADLVQNKETPVVASATRVVKGTDRSGQPTSIKKELAGLALPLSIQDTVKQVGKEGPIGLAKSTPAYVGFGVQNYGTADIGLNKTQRATVDKLKADPEKQAAAKSFYQTLKTAPDRQNASDSVNKALAAGDTQGAVKAAKEYNAQLAAAFGDWKKEHGKYASDAELVKVYNKSRIKLTKSTVKARLRSIKNNPLSQAVLGGG